MPTDLTISNRINSMKSKCKKNIWGSVHTPEKELWGFAPVVKFFRGYVLWGFVLRGFICLPFQLQNTRI